MKNTERIFSMFEESFGFDGDLLSRGIGVECEIPVVTKAGEAIDLSIAQGMFAYLEKNGFELEVDSATGLVISSSRENENVDSKFDHSVDVITTDVGYSIIELVLSPQLNLHAVQEHLSSLLSLLIAYFDQCDCVMLGYGIQPMTPPSKQLMMDKERYQFFRKFATSNDVIDEVDGADSDLLTITASNQCHIEIENDKAIVATNVLNALSGVKIAFHANSPIWRGEVDLNYKANREMFWDKCFPQRMNQVGIPPSFDTMEEYVQHILDFEPLIVSRGGNYVKIEGEKTFEGFLEKQQAAKGSTLDNEKIEVFSKVTDINELIPFSWYNARLVPKYGTIESRMCCQQPPTETLSSVALTLGLIQNLERAEKLVNRHTLNSWKALRRNAAKHTFSAKMEGESVLPLMREILDIALDGLQQRELNEEVYLTPLFERLQAQTAPADKAIAAFERGGIQALLNDFSFKMEHVYA